MQLALVVASAVIAMADGLTERLAADDQSRTVDQPLVHRELQTEIGAGEIANRGKAAHQHFMHDLAAAKSDQRRWKFGVLGEIDERGDDMDMRIDKAGHQRPALQIDALHSSSIALLRGDADDAVAFHMDLETAEQRSVVNV